MISKFLKGFVFAFKGIRYAFVSQINFRFHLFAALGIFLISYFVGLTRTEWLWIITAIFLVLIAELINTLIELLVDLISPNYNYNAGLINDISAASVLLTAVLAFTLGLFVFVPKFF